MQLVKVVIKMKKKKKIQQLNNCFKNQLVSQCSRWLLESAVQCPTVFSIMLSVVWTADKIRKIDCRDFKTRPKTKLV